MEGRLNWLLRGLCKTDLIDQSLHFCEFETMINFNLYLYLTSVAPQLKAYWRSASFSGEWNPVLLCFWSLVKPKQLR